MADISREAREVTMAIHRAVPTRADILALRLQQATNLAVLMALTNSLHKDKVNTRMEVKASHNPNMVRNSLMVDQRVLHLRMEVLLLLSMALEILSINSNMAHLLLSKLIPSKLSTEHHRPTKLLLEASSTKIRMEDIIHNHSSMRLLQLLSLAVVMEASLSMALLLLSISKVAMVAILHRENLLMGSILLHLNTAVDLQVDIKDSKDRSGGNLMTGFVFDGGKMKWLDDGTWLYLDRYPTDASVDAL